MAAVIDLPINPPSRATIESGWHLAWPHLSSRPMVLHANPGQTEWRAGAQKVRIDAWAGPLPKRRHKQ